MIIHCNVKLTKRFGEQEFVRHPSDRDGELQLLQFSINKVII